jgi:hypothetical protein
MTRKQWILLALLAAQLLLLLLVRGPMAGDMAPAEARLLFPPLESFSAARLEIQGPEEEKITLARSGDGWAIEEAGGYPANGEKIESLLDKLKEVEVRRPVVTASRYHRALKVKEDEYERRVRIWKDASGSPELDFFLGTSPNYQRTHVRQAGEDPVYAAQGLGIYDVQARPMSWFDAAFVDVKLDEVEWFRLENESGAFELRKSADGVWEVAAPEGLQDRVLDATKVQNLVRSATALRATEPVGPRDDDAQGLSSPRATFTLRTKAAEGEEAGQEVTVWIGGHQEEEDRSYIARSGFDSVAEAYETSVQKFLEQKLSDLEPGDPAS